MLKIYLRGLAITIWENKCSGVEVHESKCGLLGFLQILGNLHIKKQKMCFWGDCKEHVSDWNELHWTDWNGHVLCSKWSFLCINKKTFFGNFTGII